MHKKKLSKRKKKKNLNRSFINETKLRKSKKKNDGFSNVIR